MGIKYLNSYLMEHCSNQSIHKTHLSQLRGKTLVIDTSIYLYKFIEKDALYENIYLMISVFRKYGIVPVFVFDGKPPLEKKELLLKRKKEKDAAEEKWNEMKTIVAEAQVENENIDSETVSRIKTPEEIAKLEQEMDKLKRRFIRLRDHDISVAKHIMDAYGAYYVEAHGESDQLCAYLVKHNFAYACVSDDMDMFLYGCDRVLRHLSLVTHETVQYNTASILGELGIDASTFRDVLILSGTDYNMHDTIRLTDLFRLHGCWKTLQLEYPFSEWVKHHMCLTTDLGQIRKLFSIDEYIQHNRELLKRLLDDIPFQNGSPKIDSLKQVMREDGFLF
jgi:flap endonuclease-1